MTEENKNSSDLDVVNKKEETKDRPFWKSFIAIFGVKDETTDKIGDIASGIKKIWKVIVAVCGVILLIMMFTGKFDQAAYDMGIAGKLDSISHDYTVNQYDTDSSPEGDTIYGTEEERNFLLEYGVDLGIFQSEAHIMFVYECAKGLYDQGICTAEDARIFCENNDYDYRENPELYENYQYDAFIVMAASYDTQVTYRIAERFGTNTDAIPSLIMTAVDELKLAVVCGTSANIDGWEATVETLGFLSAGIASKASRLILRSQ